MLRKTMKLKLDELCLYVFVSLGGFLFGSILLAIISYSERGSDDYGVVPLGTMFAMMIMGFLPLLIGMLGQYQSFNCFITFGKTRKRFFVCDLAVNFIWYLITGILIIGLYYLESGMFRLFYADYPREVIFSVRLLVWAVPAAAFVQVILRMFLGSVIMRFGKKALWIIWAFWMAVCILPVRIADFIKSGAHEGAAGVFHKIAGVAEAVPLAVWGTAGVVLLLVLGVISWRLIRKQAVVVS